MVRYDTILIPTDGSPPAKRGIEHGLGIAKNNGAEVCFIQVVDRSRYGDTPALSSYELALEQIETEFKAGLQELVQQAETRGLRARYRCSRGFPHEEIVDYAEEVDADLIVMGKHGEGKAERPHLGSVADRVLRIADCPVFTV